MGGPCPPKGHKPHRYEFPVFALDTEKLPLESSAPAAMVGFFLNQHALGKAKFTGYFSRKSEAFWPTVPSTIDLQSEPPQLLGGALAHLAMSWSRAPEKAAVFSAELRRAYISHVRARSPASIIYRVIPPKFNYGSAYHAAFLRRMTRYQFIEGIFRKTATFVRAAGCAAHFPETASRESL